MEVSTYPLDMSQHHLLVGKAVVRVPHFLREKKVLQLALG